MFQQTTGAIRVNVVSASGTESTLTTVTTVTTVTSMTQVGGVSAKESMIDMPITQAWGICVRGRVT